MPRLQKHIKSKAFRLQVEVLAILCLSLTGCSNEETHVASVTEPVRTLLFYMGGDNNLSSEVNEKIERLMAVPHTPGYKILIFADTKQNGPRLMEVVGTDTGNKLDVVCNYPESNSASAEMFGSVLCEVQTLYPAPSYGLVLFSHASGWLPEGVYNNSALHSVRSVVQDGSSEMEISAFAATIPVGMLDFIIFEACHMAGVEVAWELKDKTNYIVASSAEIVSPGFSPCYVAAIPHLLKPEADLVGFCRAIEVDYATRQSNYGSLTLSLIATRGLGALADAVRSIGLSKNDGAGVQTFDRYSRSLFFDLQDAFGGAAAQQIAALRFAIDGCVLWKTATEEFMPAYGGFRIREHCGITTYMVQECYPRLNEAYKNLTWYRAISAK